MDNGLQGFNGFPVNAPVDTPTNFINPTPQPVNNQPPVNTQPQGTTILTDEQVRQHIDQLRPVAMSNPVKITEPSYLVTEKQMKYLLSLAQGNPNGALLNNDIASSFNTQPQQPYRPQFLQQPISKPAPNGGNMFDTLGNLTFGTAGRVAHTLTSIVDGVVDVLTLGYAKR